jgi:hypothetical protein
MDKEEKLVAFFTIGFITLLGLLIAGMFIFNAIEAKQKDRELSIREREIELKSEQYPYKTETKVEVKHE